MSAQRSVVPAGFSVLALVVMGFMTMSQAAAAPLLVDKGSYTTDTATNLNWLDLSSTHGLSYNQVASNSGVSYIADGWRFATSAELATMFTDAGGSGTYPEQDTSYTTYDASPTIRAVELLSNLLGSGFDPNYTSYAGLLADPAAGGRQTLGYFSAYYYPFPSPGIYSGSLLAGGDSADRDQTTYYSSFLVRDNVATTPLPASVILFLTALGPLGAVSLYKRKRAA